VLVSNNVYQFSSVSLSAGGLAEKHKIKLLAKMQEEFPNYEEAHLDDLFFWVSEIPVNGIETFLRGKAMELFEQRFGPNFSYNVSIWLRLVQGEIIRKNNFPPEDIANVEQLIAKKCIGRTFIDKTLEEIESNHKSTADLGHIKIRLASEGWSDIALMKLDKAFSSAISDFNNPTNKECNTLQQHIKDILKNTNLDSMNIAQILEKVFDNLGSENLVPPPYLNKEYICALTILVIHEEL